MTDIQERQALLQNEKLAAEIREIELRARQLEDELEPKPGGLERLWESITKNLGVSVSVLAAIVALWIQLDRFAHERSERQKLQVTTQLVALLKQLNSTIPLERRTAAVGLSLIGKEAIPVLIENLDFDLDKNTRATTIESLSGIIQRSKNAWFVLDPLLRSTEAVFDRDLSRPNLEISVDNLEAHLDALVSLATCYRERLGATNRTRIASAGDALMSKIEKGNSLKQDEKDVLLPWLNRLQTEFGTAAT